MSDREKCRSCGRELPGKAKASCRWYPFCCERCKLVDLGQWFDEKYGLTETEEPLGAEEGDKNRGNGDDSE